MDSNRLQLGFVRETTLGVTPASARVRAARITQESLIYKPDFVMSDELRPDRMTADPIKVGESNSGSVSTELIYPVSNSFLDAALTSAMLSDWVRTPERDNDGTAATAITAVAVTTNTVSVQTGAAFVAGQLVRHTGFGQAANNGVFKVTTGGATSYVCTSGAFATEASPAASARVKVVGFEGASGDIAATATGLSCTTADFTTFGLRVGQWIKIGGALAGEQFSTAVDNDWARVTAISSKSLALDNLPAGWTADAGTGKTLRVWLGDVIKNGTTLASATIERGFLSQAAPTYVQQRGMCVNKTTIAIASKQKITAAFEFLGMGGAESTISIDAVYDAAPDPAIYQVIAASANVGRIAENGVTLTAPNWAKSAQIEINNNLRVIESGDSLAPVGIGVGSLDVTVTLSTYFGSDALYSKLMAGAATNINIRAGKASRAIIFSLPRLTPVDGSPNAGGKNQDVMLSLKMSASIDTLTNSQIILNRLEYFQ